METDWKAELRTRLDDIRSIVIKEVVHAPKSPQHSMEVLQEMLEMAVKFSADALVFLIYGFHLKGEALQQKVEEDIQIFEYNLRTEIQRQFRDRVTVKQEPNKEKSQSVN